MRGFWDYTKVVKRWSKRYCDSVNGLDIQPPKGGDSWGYGEAFGYLGDNDLGDKLPFRWWGTSKVVRSVKVADEDLPPLIAQVQNNWWPHCARVSYQWAVHLCASATAERETAKWFARRHKVEDG